MKMKFKRVHQLGYVVEDMEKAMDEYGKIYGIKKWYRAVNNPVGQLYYCLLYTSPSPRDRG